MNMIYREDERERMVAGQLMSRDINNQRVLNVFRKVPRHEFVSPDLQAKAYEDYPLPIGREQTISQPYIVALMTQCLEINSGANVLEIGTGSGYQTAILAQLSGRVYSMEKYPDLAQKARETLDKLGYTNIEITSGDGTLGWPEHAPYDGIIVTAGAPAIPRPLFDQLKESGRLVIPVGNRFSQILTLVKKIKGKMVEEDFCGCVFVPLVGEYGWDK